MPNTHRGYVTVELDKARNLQYTMNSLVEIEEFINRPISELGKLSMKEIREVLFIGLRHEDPGLTAEAVGAMVDFNNIPALLEKFKEALSGGSNTAKGTFDEKKQVAV